MTDRGRHLLDITSSYSFRREELEPHFDQVTLVVLERPVIDIEVIVRAVAAIATRPLQCATAFVALLGRRRSAKARNAVVILKGLALGQWAREHRVSHVHGYWVSTAANIAFIASSIAGVQWSASLPVHVATRTPHAVAVRLRGAASTRPASLRPARKAARAYDRAKASSFPSQGVLA